MTLPNTRLAALTSTDRPLLVCYLPVGDPATSAADATLYAEHGVDIIEAGLPARTTSADGPDVAGSMARALATTGPDRAAALLAGQLDAAGRPAAVWMSYRTAPDSEYLDAVAASGVGGVLLPDADPHELAVCAARHGLIDIPFLAHDPRPEQVAAAERAGAYVLLAAHGGVTGLRDDPVDPANGAVISRLRSRGVRRPLLLGFGISTPDHVRAALDLGARGVVVGTACVRAALAGRTSLRTLFTGLRQALDG